MRKTQCIFTCDVCGRKAEIDDSDRSVTTLELNAADGDIYTRDVHYEICSKCNQAIREFIASLHGSGKGCDELLDKTVDKEEDDEDGGYKPETRYEPVEGPGMDPEAERTADDSPFRSMQKKAQSWTRFFGGTKKCPKCEDGVLIRRAGKFGPFLGCSNFPQCKHTENIQPEGCYDAPVNDIDRELDMDRDGIDPFTGGFDND